MKGTAFVLLAALSLAAHQKPPLPEGTIQVPAGSGTWVDAPLTLPAGTKMMLLEGNPAQDGFFTMRLQLPAGARIQPHWHPREERVTILSGQARVGFGDRFDEAAMTTFGPGSFYVNPPKSHHYVWIVEPTVMQLTGTGPWQLHMLDQKARPQAAESSFLTSRMARVPVEGRSAGDPACRRIEARATASAANEEATCSRPDSFAGGRETRKGVRDGTDLVNPLLQERKRYEESSE